MTKSPTKQGTGKQSLVRFESIMAWLLIVCGIVGIIASVMITVEKFDLLKNPNYQPVCDLNPIISCGSVMKSDQANAFGFMNTYIGLLGFPVVLTIGVAMLAGARFKRWFWLGLQVGLTAGVLFAYWLLFESIFRIRALCPYCLSIDVVITFTFWYATLYNISHGYLPLPARLKRAGGFVKRHHLDILLFWYFLVVVLILQHFWYYFGQHI